MGRQHLRVLSTLPGVEIVAVCDGSQEACDWATSVVSTAAVSSYRQLLDYSPDAVVNALPTTMHFETTKLFLDASCAVLVEKPIASSVEEASELAELATEKGLVLMVG